MSAQVHPSVAELMQLSGVGFGTSGARGLVSAMTDRICYAYTRAFLDYLREQQSTAPAQIAVASDLRPSSPRIAAACLRAIADSGAHGVYLGQLPSPALAYWGFSQGCPSLMVTGSHIPDDRNGIKFNTASGEILKADEAGIRRQTPDLSDDLFDDAGRFRVPSVLPQADASGLHLYLRRYLDFYPQRPLDGMRLGVYQHSAVGRDLMVELLTELGAEVTPLGRSERFVPVDTEAIRPEDIELARDWSQQHGFDSILSTDGDGDRPLVSDERGEWLQGDVLGIISAHFLQAEGVVTPVSSNSALEASGLFRRTLRTRIGSPFVIEGMQQLLAEGIAGVVGYEANGGLLLADPVHDQQGRTLPALPTRDALLPILCILLAARQQGKTISALRAALPPRFTRSDRLKQFPREVAEQRLAALRQGSEHQQLLAAAALLGQRFATPVALDHTDGLRMRLANEDIVHLRPSGNAPEMRAYCESASPQRAHELLRMSLELLRTWLDTEPPK
jgi:phosphomannomutase